MTNGQAGICTALHCTATRPLAARACACASACIIPGFGRRDRDKELDLLEKKVPYTDLKS